MYDRIIISNTGYFASDNKPDGIENATHNTFAKQTWIFCASISVPFRRAHYHSPLLYIDELSLDTVPKTYLSAH
jgi:hypothetical protein